MRNPIVLICAWLCTAAAVLAPACVYANIYSFTDADGVTHFTNVPTDSRYRLLYRSTPRGIGKINKRVLDDDRISVRNQKRYRDLVDAIAEQEHVDRALLHAVVAVESGYNPKAVSPKGAIGLMQVMPATARRYGISMKDLFNPRENLRAGAMYLGELLQRFRDIRLALAAYNAGEDAIAKYGNRIPPYEETAFYVPRVMRFYQQFQRGM